MNFEVLVQSPSFSTHQYLQQRRWSMHRCDKMLKPNLTNCSILHKSFQLKLAKVFDVPKCINKQTAAQYFELCRPFLWTVAWIEWNMCSYVFSFMCLSPLKGFFEGARIVVTWRPQSMRRIMPKSMSTGCNIYIKGTIMRKGTIYLKIFT